jgi:Uma2 family endonuclease
MVASALTLLTYAEHLAAEKAADERSIFWDYEVFAMAGGTPTHNRIAAAILRDLGAPLRGKSCQPYGSDQRIAVLTSKRYVYADASVTCRPVQTDPLDSTAIANPTLVAEVLSDSTEAFDRGAKFQGYRTLRSLKDYLLFSQYEPRVEHFCRNADDSWTLRTYGPSDTIKIASLAIELAVAALYEGTFDT